MLMEELDKINLDKVGEKKASSNSFEDQNYDKVVPLWVWLLINFAIGLIGSISILGPIIVLIILLVLAFGDVNQNLKNWARADLILIIVSSILLLIFVPSLFREIMIYLFTKK